MATTYIFDEEIFDAMNEDSIFDYQLSATTTNISLSGMPIITLNEHISNIVITEDTGHFEVI